MPLAPPVTMILRSESFMARKPIKKAFRSGPRCGNFPPDEKAFFLADFGGARARARRGARFRRMHDARRRWAVRSGERSCRHQPERRLRQRSQLHLGPGARAPRRRRTPDGLFLL